MSVSRRAQWEHMRMEVRQRAEDPDNTSLSDGTPDKRAVPDSDPPSAISPAPLEREAERLQRELAEEKRRNIAAERRVQLLEREVLSLRANRPSGPLDQMVRELQEDLRLAKQYARDLEGRLAEMSAALERRGREVSTQDDRIRQLERTIADELIRRSRDATPAVPAIPTIPTAHTNHTNNNTNTPNNNTNTPNNNTNTPNNTNTNNSNHNSSSGHMVPSTRRVAVLSTRVPPGSARAALRPDGDDTPRRFAPLSAPKATTHRARTSRRDSGESAARQTRPPSAGRRPSTKPIAKERRAHRTSASPTPSGLFDSPPDAAGRAFRPLPSGADTRSVASTTRTRPRIHSDDGAGRSSTTVVTRSAKRRESPSLVPPPRAERVLEVQSDTPFVSERFAATTYRPNRLLRCHAEGETTPKAAEGTPHTQGNRDMERVQK